MIDQRLKKLLNNTTAVLSKGASTHKYLSLLGIPENLHKLLPSVADWPGYVVDCDFVAIGVNAPLAQAQAHILRAILGTFPEAAKLSEGPSYHYLAQFTGGKLEALRLIALGEACGLWGIVTPATLGATPDLQVRLSLLGFICLSGYPNEVGVLHELAAG